VGVYKTSTSLFELDYFYDFIFRVKNNISTVRKATIMAIGSIKTDQTIYGKKNLKILLIVIALALEYEKKLIQIKPKKLYSKLLQSHKSLLPTYFPAAHFFCRKWTN